MFDELRLFDRVLERLCSAELGDAHRRHLDGFARARVARSASGASLHRENAEAGDRALLALLEAIRDRLDHGLNSLLCGDFRSAEFLVDCFNNRLFVHRIAISRANNLAS